MSRYFAIHGTMRTGSNLLEKSLAALGDTACYGEAFNPGFTGGPRKADLLGWSVAMRDADPFGFLAALRRAAGGRIAGFRIFDGHAPAVAAHTLEDPDCARIVLRRDPLHAWVSLTIARETGQWMLRDPRRRQAAMVRFDPAAFTAWRERVARHYEGIESAMARAGTTALWLDYERLTEPATIAAAARHIGSRGEAPTAPPIVRQNPERLAEKVENYAELCDWLGHCPDPPVRAPVPGAEDVLFSRHLAIAVAPVAGPALAPALALVQRLEARATGGRAVAPSRLMADAGAHFLRGLDPAAAAREAAGRHVLAPVCHPAERLHGLFVEAVFGAAPPGAPATREALAARLGALPTLRDVQRGTAAFGTELHRAAFAAWLDLLAEASAGRGALAASPARLAQAEAVAAFRAGLRLDRVALHEAFAELAADLATATGQPRLPPGQVAALARTGMVEAFPLSRVLDAELAARVRALHGEDFAAFGYATMPGG